jgi:uncharacterized protein
MKYLLLLAVLAVAYGLWRNKHRQPPPQRPVAQPPAPLDMVACAHCGVHLPRTEALAQGRLHYCCAEHRSSGPR